MESTLVWYYLEGWRVGIIEKNDGFTATIRPISAKGGKVPRVVRVPSDDVRIVEETGK